MVQSVRTWLIAGLGLLLILALLLPGQAVLFAGAAAGWVLVALFVFRSRERMDYQKAVRHMRRGEYRQAIQVMDKLIDSEADAQPCDRLRWRFTLAAVHHQVAVADCFDVQAKRGIPAACRRRQRRLSRRRWRP